MYITQHPSLFSFSSNTISFYFLFLSSSSIHFHLSHTYFWAEILASIIYVCVCNNHTYMKLEIFTHPLLPHNKHTHDTPHMKNIHYPRSIFVVTVFIIILLRQPYFHPHACNPFFFVILSNILKYFHILSSYV